MKTVLHYYRFDVSNEIEKQEYKKLSAKLKSEGLTLFDSISPNHSEYYKKLIAPLDGKAIELETEYLFNNQWNTAPTETSDKGLRVFDWSEAIYPNKKIKEGMYLDQAEEMQTIRKETYECNYCGAKYNLPTQQFCDKCLGSEHLTEDNLKLLFLTPVNKEMRNFDSIVVPDILVNSWKEQQRINRAARIEERKERKLQSLKDDITAAKKEFDAFNWLIQHDIDFDNVIYYKHSDEFCFGWRNPIPQREADKLQHKLNVEGFTVLFTARFKTV